MRMFTSSVIWAMYGSICHFASSLADGLSVNDFKNIFVSMRMITNNWPKKKKTRNKNS